LEKNWLATEINLMTRGVNALYLFFTMSVISRYSQLFCCVKTP
jgi:hypothetical protein